MIISICCTSFRGILKNTIIYVGVTILNARTIETLKIPTELFCVNFQKLLLPLSDEVGEHIHSRFELEVVTNRDMGKQNTGHVKGKNNVVENIRLRSLLLCPVQYMVSFVRSVPPDATVHKVKLSSPFSKDRWVEIWPCIFSVPKSMRKTFYLDHSVSDLIADLLKQRFCKN